MSYDQWKTASPHDDEVDITQELEKHVKELEEYIRVHAELSDLTSTERSLLERSVHTMKLAADYIEEYI